MIAYVGVTYHQQFENGVELLLLVFRALPIGRHLSFSRYCRPITCSRAEEVGVDKGLKRNSIKIISYH